MRWVDPLKEISADAMAMKFALKSPQQIGAEGGLEAFDIVNQPAEWQAWAKDNGIVLPEVLPGMPGEQPETSPRNRR